MPPQQCGRGDDDACAGERGTRSHSGEDDFTPHYDYVPGPARQPESTGVDAPTISDDVATVGVKRPITRGTAGQPLTVTINNFKITLPAAKFYHYAGRYFFQMVHHLIYSILWWIYCIIVDIQLDEPKPIKWNHQLMCALQERVAPAIFTPRAVYDGRKDLFARRYLPLAGGNGNTETLRRH
ncbi:unnamed protein product [Rhizoctonia solani]|uniref:Protein argonaute N-terminal domain-containing protein n=1 Tax=Rhizoctonia solani TaxID=456999 RepID=A0A8H3GWG3_9AGAM|nr:unnamed protein product [Rhizoctonia solani]